MADERIGLQLDLGNASAKAKELASSLGSVRAAAQGVADVYDVVGDTYELATTEVDDFADSIMAEIAAANRAAASTDSLARSKHGFAVAADRASDSAGKANKRLEALSRGALQTSQALQDVAQGGLASGLNNIDGIVGNLAKSMGLTTTAAAALGAGLLGVGTVALLAGPPLWDWYTHLGEIRNDIPPATDALQAYSDAIRENSKWIADATEKGYLLDDEIVEHGRRVAENTQLEKDAAEAKKAKTNAEKLAAIQTDEAAATAKKAADALQDQLAGKSEDVIASLTSVMTAKSDELKGAAKLWDQINKDYAEALDGATDIAQRNAITAAYTKQLEDVKKIQADIKKRIGANATNLVGDAVLTGSQGAIDAIKKAFSGTSSAFKDVFRTVNSDIEDELDRQAEEFYNRQQQAWQVRFDAYAAGVAEKAKAAQEKINAELAKMSPNQFEGINTPLDLALAFDDQGNPTWDPNAAMEEAGQGAVNAGIRRRSALRKPIRQVADSFGIDLSRQQLEAAAGMVDWGQGQGMMQAEAIAAALQEIVNNQMMMADGMNMNGGQLQQIRRQAARVPSLLQWGAGQ